MLAASWCITIEREATPEFQHKSLSNGDKLDMASLKHSSDDHHSGSGRFFGLSKEQATTSDDRKLRRLLGSDAASTESIAVETLDPPSMNQATALKTAKRLADFVAGRADGYHDWQLEVVGLTRLGSEQSWWAYQIHYSASSGKSRFWNQLSFLLLMDGRIAFDPSCHNSVINDAIRDFDSTAGVEIIWATDDQK